MIRKTKAIDDELLSLCQTELKKQGVRGENGRRLQAIISAREHGIKAVAEIYNISRETLMRWIRKFKDGGSSSFSVAKGRGRSSKLSEAQKLEIKSYIEKTGAQLSSKRLQSYIVERFGTHSRIGHGWFKTRLRPEVKKKLGYQNFYLYGAVSAKTGDSFSLIMPNVDVDWMNKFLEEFSLNLKSKKAILVMDQAGWHKSSNLVIPKNIKIIHLSPYSPELNPAEKLWQFIKDNILKNVIYDTLNELEEKLCDFINNINSKQILSVCNVNYMPYHL